MSSLVAGFKSIKTFLAGLAALLSGLGLLGAAISALLAGQLHDLQAIITAFGAAFAAIGTGIGLMFAKDADKSNAPSPTSAPVSTPKGFSTLPFLVALLGLVTVIACMAPGRARADSSPGGPLSVCINGSCSFRVSPGFAFAGTFYTKSADGVQIARNVSVAGMAVLTTPLQFDAVVGPAWQTGTAQGWGASAGVAEKSSGANFTALASALNVGGRLTWAFGLGTISRF